MKRDHIFFNWFKTLNLDLWVYKCDSKMDLELYRLLAIQTERRGHTEEYWLEVVAVRTKRSKVCTKSDWGPIFPVRLKLARLISSLLLIWYSAMLVLYLPPFKNKRYTAYECFHEKILTKKKPIRMLRFPSRLPCHTKKANYSPMR